MINLNTTKKEMQLIVKIAQRAFSMDMGYEDFQALNMDIAACHLNGNPLKLEELLNADDFNFAHDVNGINRHMNRETGKLTNSFSPRYSKRT